MRAFSWRQRMVLAVVPAAAAALIRLLGATLRYRDVCAAAADSTSTPVGIDVAGPTVFVFWHRALLVCAHRFRERGIAILISQSFDGELVARTVAKLGFLPVRGSSTRGGAGGLRAMAEAYGRGHRCAFTADGPKGPALVAKPGAVQLASLAGAAWIGAFDAEPDRAWTLRTWDGFRIPKPFSTVTFSWPAHCAVQQDAVQRALDEAVRMANAGEAASSGEAARTSQPRDL